MSNRRKWHKKEQPASSSMPIRIGLAFLGAVLFAMGWEARAQGYLWVVSFSERYGRPVEGTTLSWMVLGVLLILAGIFPWDWLSRRMNRK